jgi:hypothetical protein
MKSTKQQTKEVKRKVMCKPKLATFRLPVSVGITALCGLLAACMPQAAQAQSCNPGGGGSIQVVGPYAAPFDAFVHVGELGNITSAVFNNDGSCSLTNFRAWVVYPTNNVSMYIDLNPLHQTVPPTPSPGFQISCPSADTRCIPFQQSFLIRLQDIGNKIDFTTNWPPGSSSMVSFAGQANTVQVGLLAAGDAIRTGGGHGGEQKAAGLIVLQPCVNITKVCDFAPGQTCFPLDANGNVTIKFTGVVTNCSPEPNSVLTVTLSDNPAATITFDDSGTATTTLDNTHRSQIYHGSYSLTGTGCGIKDDTITVTATDQTGKALDPVTATAHCPVCRPEIKVFKDVACAPNTGCAGCSTLDPSKYSKTATGVQGVGSTQMPAFCYRITVTNSGCDILNNVTVNDPTIGSDVVNAFPSTLNPGDSVTHFFCKSWGLNANGSDSTNVNTVIANGQSATTGTGVSSTNSATAIVRPANVVCTLFVHSAFDQDGHSVVTDTNGVTTGADDNHVCFAQDGSAEAVDVYVFITNTGVANLCVDLTGMPCATPLDASGAPVTSCIEIAAGATAGPFTCPGVPVTLACAGAQGVCTVETNFTAHVQGTAEATVSSHIECIFDANGHAIKTVTHDCSGDVGCIPMTPPMQVLCRTTGGGDLIPGTSDNNCGTVNTIISPLNQCGQTIDKITHGGQLGAPFSQSNCGQTIGDPCIRGNWSHHRHFAGGNTADEFDVDFHSSTPGVRGVYDSLDCACLGCCDPTTGAFIPSTGGFSKNGKKQLCNPDNRICGPEPRPAPANAIIFSGIGTFKLGTECGSKNAKATFMVFRVYIEDRSEPGGFHPKGSTPPADVYCFQAWDTGIVVQKNSDPNALGNSSLLGDVNAFRTAVGQANCAFLDGMGAGSIPIGSLPNPTVSRHTATINDCGPMAVGNHQIHPATGATCSP